MAPGSLDPAKLFAAFSQAQSAEKPALLLTGRIGSGKTQAANLLARILLEKGFSTAGVLSPRILRAGETVGYVVQDIHTGKTLPLCAISPDELFLLMEAVSSSSEPSPQEGANGFFFPNSLGPQVGEGNKENVPRGSPPQSLPPKGGEQREQDEAEASLFQNCAGTAPGEIEHFFAPLGADASGVPFPPGGEGQGEIFRFRRFFFSHQALDFGNSVLKEAAGKAEVVVVDEVGPLELSGRGFAPGLGICRESGAFLILTVRPHLLSPVKRWLDLESAEVLFLHGEGRG
jgi:nucleoside-triphosphatase THEP1